jgi:hypothetical protein
MRKTLATLASLTALLTTVGGVSSASANSGPSYRVQVIIGTHHYAPCIDMRATKAGRLMYRDMVSDTWDDGRKRTVKAQISYVKQGCRNGA